MAQDAGCRAESATHISIPPLHILRGRQLLRAFLSIRIHFCVQLGKEAFVIGYFLVF